MPRKKTFAAANIEIECDERCPIYYCNDPCRVERHAKTYAKLIGSGLSCSLLSGGE